MVVLQLLPKYSDITLENYVFSSLEKASWKILQKDYGFNAHIFNNIRVIQLKPTGYMIFHQIVPSISQVYVQASQIIFFRSMMCSTILSENLWPEKLSHIIS